MPIDSCGHSNNNACARPLRQEQHQEAIRLFLSQHAMVHSASMARSGEWSFEDEVLDGLAEKELRTRPAGQSNSIAWLLWHMARI